LTPLHFQGTAEPLALVQIFVNNALMGSGRADAQGNYLIQLTGLLPDGTYDVTGQQTDLAGNVGPVSGRLTPRLVIDKPTPVAPSAPNLVPADDTGLSNSDHITMTRQPRFQGTAAPNSKI